MMSNKLQIKKLIKRIDKARDFPFNTCSASRSLENLAINISKTGKHKIKGEDCEIYVIELLTVIASLYESRTVIHKIMTTKPNIIFI